jgi:hypothetical protein
MNPDTINTLVARGALFVANHSGGKDSQAMLKEPHPAYAAGNERLSCVFCIMGSRNDLAHGARARPDLFAKYVAMEKATGYTMHMSRKPLAELVREARL